MDAGNMGDIFALAQKVASSMDVPRSSDGNVDTSKIDMASLFQQVSSTVQTMVTPDVIESMRTTITEKSSSPKNKSSKKTKDLHFDLNVSLKHLYCGKKKNVAVKRKRFVDVDGERVLQDERKVISVQIEPGMRDEDVIVFEGESDEHPRYGTGDIVITLCYDEDLSNNGIYRINDDLFMTKTISLPECYRLEMTITHIDGQEFSIKRSGENIIKQNNLIKVENKGMPIRGTDQYGNLYIKLVCDIPDTLDESVIETLSTIFEKLNTSNGNNELEFTEINQEEFGNVYESDESNCESDIESEADAEKIL